MAFRRSKTFSIAALLMAAILSGEPDVWAQSQPRRLGILAISGEKSSREYDATFYERLRREGWIEGKNVVFFFGSAQNAPSRYPRAAAELLRQRVDAIYADSAPAIRAAYAATHTVPIIGSDYTTDPVAAGYADSYGRPGRNVTGVFLDAPAFSGKWIELLKSIVPDLSKAAVLWDPSPGDTHLRALENIADSVGLALQIVEVRTPDDIDAAGSVIEPNVDALFIVPSPMMYFDSARTARLAMRAGLPAISMAQQFADNGGLLAYGPEQDSANERVAVLVAKVLEGASPGSLPIERPARYELVVNLKTAKALGLTIPDAILTQADRVIR